MSGHAYSAQAAPSRRRLVPPRWSTGPAAAIGVAALCVVAMVIVWAVAELVPSAHFRDAVLLHDFIMLGSPRVDRVGNFLLHLLEPGCSSAGGSRSWRSRLRARARARRSRSRPSWRSRRSARRYSSRCSPTLTSRSATCKSARPRGRAGTRRPRSRWCSARCSSLPPRLRPLVAAARWRIRAGRRLLRC